MKKFLTFEDVSKSFDGTLVVDAVSVDIHEGEIFALLGPSGCGKTTLLRLLAGFIEPDSGRILIDGQDIRRLPPERRPVNTVFQNYALFPHLSIRDNIAFGLKMAGRRKGEIAAAVDRMLELVDLDGHGHKKPSQISGGQKQRVAIARALVNQPRVLLLDEPLAALDLKLRQRLLVDLDGLHDEVGTTFLYITHDQTEAMAISDRIGVMQCGRLRQIGTPAEIYEAPEDSFVAAFIGDTNFFHGEVSARISDEYSRANLDGIGEMIVYNDRRIQEGDRIDLSLRPEKLRIHREAPADLPPGWNRLEAEVEDVVYLGSLTRYWVRAGETRIAVEHQHSHFLLDEKPPTWKDRVTVSWCADDGYLLRNFRAGDAELLSLSPEDEEPPP